MSPAKKKPQIAIVAAVARNGVIGVKNGLPWRLSTDLKRFKATTMGKPVIMGRKTWESIGRPLPGRTNIVVTRNAFYKAEGAMVAASLSEAIDMAISGEDMVEEVCVIGGGQIYREAMPIADRLYITRVEAEPEGDTGFPPIDEAIWRVVTQEAFPGGEKDSYATRFVIYQRSG